MRLKFLPSTEADGIPSIMERQQVSRFRRASLRFAVFGQKFALLFLFLLYYYLLQSMFPFVGWFAGENELL
jgi:hypothetical protein